MAESDVVITAAVIPGKKSPVLVTKDMVEKMAPGSVIVDLAAERGGNCELTKPDEIVVEHNVTIIGEFNLAGDGALSRQRAVCAKCERVSAAPGERRKAATGYEGRNHPGNDGDARRRSGERAGKRVFRVTRTAVDTGRGRRLMKLDLLTGLYVFMLAAFIGFEVIRRVSPLLHTPLMSLTNALDAIAVVGAIILAGEGKSTLATILGTIAIVAATSNIVGGFIITDRMLKMFKASGPRKP